ncbi:MAG: MnhB domain-containing protein [Ilumatobacter sp.]
MIASRSLVVRDGIRLASPLAIVVATLLFFIGHNQPGGGFASGLVFGAVIALRHAVGLPIPKHPLQLMAAGGIIIGLVAIAPLVVGDVLLDQYVWEATLPLLGKVKAGSALIFDLGVVGIVVGLVGSMLSSLASAPGDLVVGGEVTAPVDFERVAVEQAIEQAHLAAHRAASEADDGVEHDARGAS